MALDVERVTILGFSVDDTPGGGNAPGPGQWRDGGPGTGRNNLDPVITERIPNRAINRVYELIDTLNGVVEEFDDRITMVVGEVPGADQAAFDALGGNLIHAVTAGGGGGTDDGVY